MNYFEKKPYILKKPEAKKIIKNFNTIAGILIQYELVYSSTWKNLTDAIKTGEQLTNHHLIIIWCLLCLLVS